MVASDCFRDGSIVVLVRARFWIAATGSPLLVLGVVVVVPGVFGAEVVAVIAAVVAFFCVCFWCGVFGGSLWPEGYAYSSNAIEWYSVFSSGKDPPLFLVECDLSLSEVIDFLFLVCSYWRSIWALVFYGWRIHDVSMVLPRLR